MTPSEYRATLAVIGMTASVVQQLFDVDEFASRKGATGDLPVPAPIALSLWLMAAHRQAWPNAIATTGAGSRKLL
ncbi:hypothetical protein ASC90_26420 [Rhizobium sp. Root1220]|nr:hypothetical protein ASC90_26420 [Rhizobium sp. Root1220]